VADPQPSQRTRALVIAAVLLALEGVLSLGFGILELTQLHVSRLVLGGGVAFIMVCYAVLLLTVARGVFRGRRWSRAPGIATQLLQLPLAWSFRGPQAGWVAAALALGALIVLVCLLLPTSTVIFVPEAERRPKGSQP
jgi:hypothetical protein